MNILNTSTGSQDITFITRKDDDTVYITLKDENTRVETYYTSSAVKENGSSTVSGSFELSEGRFYVLSVKNTSDEFIYRGRIYCTDQTDYKNYDMNLNQYTSSNDTDGVIML